MKKFLLPLLALGAIVTALPHAAEARGRFFFDFGFPIFAGPAYYAPPPAYYYPPPPREVYYAPQPQVVYAQPVQYYAPQYAPLPPGYHYEYR